MDICISRVAFATEKKGILGKTGKLIKKMDCWWKLIVIESWLLKNVNRQEKEDLCTMT